MRRRTLLAAALPATAGCSQLPFGSGGGGDGASVTAENARLETIGGETHPVLSLSHTAGNAVIPGVGIDLAYLDGSTVVDSLEQYTVAPPGETTLWAPALPDTSFDSVRIDGVSVVDPARPVTNEIAVSDTSFSGENVSARFDNTTSSPIELYPYLVGTYQGTAVLPENATSGLNAVKLEAGQAVTHEAVLVHENVDLVDGVEAYPCVSS